MAGVESEQLVSRAGERPSTVICISSARRQDTITLLQRNLSDWYNSDEDHDSYRYTCWIALSKDYVGRNCIPHMAAKHQETYSGHCA